METYFVLSELVPRSSPFSWDDCADRDKDSATSTAATMALFGRNKKPSTQTLRASNGKSAAGR
jgi:hypothetical protein